MFFRMPALSKLSTPVAGVRTQLRAAVRLIGNPDVRLLKITVEVLDSDTGNNTTSPSAILKTKLCQVRYGIGPHDNS